MQAVVLDAHHSFSEKPMAALDQFPITAKWPAKNPDIIQLYSLPTPNGIKVSAMLEETGLAYEPHLVNFGSNDQLTPEFMSLNPNNKIPAIIDPNGPGNAPIGLWESGAILIYLAEKSGRFLSSDPRKRMETLQWLMWQMGGLGPMFGQLGFFHTFAGKDFEDKRPKQRYVDESRRLLTMLDKHLTDREFVAASEHSIADMAVWPWLNTFYGFYKAGELVGDEAAFPHVRAYLERQKSRPASLKAVSIPART
jgi:GSH-dependent disulfide-bond oxidoreductase